MDKTSQLAGKIRFCAPRRGQRGPILECRSLTPPAEPGQFGFGDELCAKDPQSVQAISFISPCETQESLLIPSAQLLNVAAETTWPRSSSSRFSDLVFVETDHKLREIVVRPLETSQ